MTNEHLHNNGMFDLTSVFIPQHLSFEFLRSSSYPLPHVLVCFDVFTLVNNNINSIHMIVTHSDNIHSLDEHDKI